MTLTGSIFSILPLSFIVLIIEMVAMGLFLEWSYALGIVVLRYKIDLKLPRLYQEDKMEFQTARVKFISPTKILFRSKIVIFTIRMNTPFPVKGTIFEKDGETIVEGRVPLGSTIFLGFIFFSLIGGGLLLSLVEGRIGMFLGILTMATIFYFVGRGTLSLEKSRAVDIVDELCLTLS